MREGLLLGVSHLLTNAPYFVLAAALFWRQRRYSGRATVLAFASLLLAHAASDFLLTAFYTGNVWWLPIQFISFCIGCMALLFGMFRVSFARVLYCFLLLRSVYTAILYVVLNAFMLALPGQYIGFDETPLYTLAAALAMWAMFPLLWRYFTGRLRTAFSELDEKTIRQLCVPPVLFFLLDQCYSTIRDTLEYDSFQTAAIFLLMLLTGLATYYVNLRTALDTARRIRRESEMQTQLALQAQGYENLTRSIEAARAARHDLRHHMSVIRQYAARGDTEALAAYISEYMSALPPDDAPDWCENRPVNALLKHYLARAAQAGAVLDVKLDVPLRTGIPDTDLCVVFGNVFENAAKSAEAQAEACRIRARCACGGGELTLTVENSAHKEGEPGEGLGLASVEAVAKKHGGAVRFEKRGDAYFSAVMLRLPAD